MAAYQTFTNPRQTQPDTRALLANLRAAVSSDVGVYVADQVYRCKKGTAWSPSEIVAAQSVIDACPAASDRVEAQHDLDDSIVLRAVVLALIDQLNVIRSKLPVPLGAITPQQALDAIKAKAATL
jgi:hypothetical protein